MQIVFSYPNSTVTMHVWSWQLTFLLTTSPHMIPGHTLLLVYFLSSSFAVTLPALYVPSSFPILQGCYKPLHGHCGPTGIAGNTDTPSWCHQYPVVVKETISYCTIETHNKWSNMRDILQYSDILVYILMQLSIVPWYYNTYSNSLALTICISL